MGQVRLRPVVPNWFFPFPPPMDEVHGIISISFAGVSTCLPMLSPFHIRNPCSERESFQTRNLGSYKDSNPPCRRRAANNRAGRKKESNCPGCGFARPEIANSTYAKTFYPHGLCPWDGNGKRIKPAWAHAHAGKKQQGSALQPAGAVRPQTPLVDTSHTRHDTSWAVTKEKHGGYSPPNPLENKKRFKPALLPACREQQGGKGKKQVMGATRPQTPLKIKKDSNPPCCPRAANNRAGREKEKHGGCSPPNPQPGCRLVAMA